MSMCHLMRLVRIVRLLQLADLLYDCFAGPSESFSVLCFSHTCVFLQCIRMFFLQHAFNTVSQVTAGC